MRLKNREFRDFKKFKQSRILKSKNYISQFKSSDYLTISF